MTQVAVVPGVGGEEAIGARSAENGVAVIPGRRPGEAVIVNAHVDAWFDGAGDNADGLAVMVALARHFAKPEHRPQTYARVQRVYRAFIARNGSICCAELLGREKKPESPTPDARTNAYYSSRPCAKIIRMTCKIIDEMLAENAAGQED